MHEMMNLVGWIFILKQLKLSVKSWDSMPIFVILYRFAADCFESKIMTTSSLDWQIYPSRQQSFCQSYCDPVTLSLCHFQMTTFAQSGAFYWTLGPFRWQWQGWTQAPRSTRWWTIQPTWRGTNISRFWSVSCRVFFRRCTFHHQSSDFFPWDAFG